MRTNVVLDESKVAELVELSGARSKTAAVAQAVNEEIRRRKLRRLCDLLGTVDTNDEEIRAADEAERASLARLLGEEDADAG